MALTFLELVLTRSFFYTPDASFSEGMNKLTSYMKENGFELSREKTCLMLFKNPKSLPQIELDGPLLNYKQNTKFLGVYITTKLNWRLHIENSINKASKRLNFQKKKSYSLGIRIQKRYYIDRYL